MAYFSNSTEGEPFDDQCAECRGWARQCPIAMCQITFNYDQMKSANLGDYTARMILDALVSDKGTCNVFKIFKKELTMTEDEKNQLDLFRNENPKGL